MPDLWNVLLKVLIYYAKAILTSLMSEKAVRIIKSDVHIFVLHDYL